MAGPTALYEEMFKEMKDLTMPMSAKKILGPRGRYLTTWGDVDEFMQRQQARYKFERFVTRGHAATQLLQKLCEFYLANEARKASNNAIEPESAGPTVKKVRFQLPEGHVVTDNAGGWSSRSGNSKGRKWYYW